MLIPPAGQASTQTDQAQLDKTKAALVAIQQKLASSRGQAAVIQSQVKALTAQIDSLNRQVAAQTRAVDDLKTSIDSDTVQINRLQSDYGAAQQQTNARARAAYMEGPGASLAGLLTSNSVSDFIQKSQVWEVAAQLDTKVLVRSARLRQAVQTEQQARSAAKADLQAQQRALLDRTALLNTAQSQQTAALDAVQVTISQEVKNEQELTAESQNLTLVLQADAQASRSAAAAAAAAAAASAARATPPTAAPASRTPGTSAADPLVANPPGSRPSLNPPATNPPMIGTTGGGSASGLIWPVRGPITSPFGPRPSLGGYHYGIDIGDPTGTPIHAAKSGTILSVNCGSGYGICTIIDHGNGLTTLYAHQSRSDVGAGQQVSQGQVIGAVGCTGFCTGPHLHFEVRIDGVPHNPIQYLPG